MLVKFIDTDNQEVLVNSEFIAAVAQCANDENERLICVFSGFGCNMQIAVHHTIEEIQQIVRGELTVFPKKINFEKPENTEGTQALAKTIYKVFFTPVRACQFDRVVDILAKCKIITDSDYAKGNSKKDLMGTLLSSNGQIEYKPVLLLQTEDCEKAHELVRALEDSCITCNMTSHEGM